MAGKLHGLTILVPESRELDLFAGMLEAEGARAVRCPLVTILDVEDPAPVDAWLDRLIRGEFSDLVLLTGEGLRRLLALAERTSKQADAVGAIGRLRTIVRGPKPTRALREIGLAPGLSAAVPTSPGVIATLSSLDLRGRVIGLQLYPEASDRSLESFVVSAGAQAFPVVPYRYASHTESAAVADAIRRMAAGEIDVVAFTSSQQVARLLEVSGELGLEQELAEGWRRTRVASIGPIVSDALAAHGVEVAAQPASNFHLKPLVGAIVEMAGRR